MTKRAHLTVEEVQHQLQLLDDNALSDEDCFDDPDEPVIEGSDDEFSDLEGDKCDDAGDIDENMDTHSMPSHPSDPHSTSIGALSSSQGATSSSQDATSSSQGATSSSQGATSSSQGSSPNSSAA